MIRKESLSALATHAAALVTSAMSHALECKTEYCNYLIGDIGTMHVHGTNK